MRVNRHSGRGQPHSKTQAQLQARWGPPKVLECGCPLPLWVAGQGHGDAGTLRVTLIASAR